jgi:KUP system potassium uptake protein
MSWHLQQFGALQKSLVSLTVRFEEVPWLTREERVDVEPVADGFWHVTVHFGFMEVPDLPEALACAKEAGCDIDLDKAIYFGARDKVVRSDTAPLLSAWRLKLFSLLNRNAVHMVDRFHLRGGQFVDIGRQLEL